MRKLVIIAVLFCMSFVTYAQKDSSKIETIVNKVAQVDSTVTTTTSSVERLVDKYAGKLESTIVALAKALKQPAEYVYKILVRQQLIIAITDIITILMCFGLAFWLMNFTMKDYHKTVAIKKEPSYYSVDFGDSWWPGGIVVGCLFAVIGLICFFSFKTEIVTGLLNPEYGAMEAIVNFIK